MPEINTVQMSRYDYDVMRTAEETYEKLRERLAVQHQKAVREVQEAGALYIIEEGRDYRGRTTSTVRVVDSVSLQRELASHLPNLKTVQKLEELIVTLKNELNSTNTTRTPRWWDCLLGNK